MTAELQGKVALVTGAGRGIGREVAIGLAAAGARVALVARTEYELQMVADAITRDGGDALAITADLSAPDQAKRTVAATASQLGEIDVLINNAAVVAPLGRTDTLSPRQIEIALAVNVGAAIILTGLVLPGMRAAGWGRIVNLSSGIASSPAAMIGGTVYAATKAALEAHTINLAAELDGTGVTANVYRPGMVDTAMQKWIRDQSPEEIGHALHERFVSSHATGQLITPELSARGLLEHLAGQDNGQIWVVGATGQVSS